MFVKELDILHQFLDHLSLLKLVVFLAQSQHVRFMLAIDHLDLLVKDILELLVQVVAEGQVQLMVFNCCHHLDFFHQRLHFDGLVDAIFIRTDYFSVQWIADVNVLAQVREKLILLVVFSV